MGALRVSVLPGRMAGGASAPDSKSHAHRLLICAALCQGETRISLRAPSDDVLATARCLRALGAGIDISEGELRVIGIGARVRGRARVLSTGMSAEDAEAALYTGESGATYRFLLPVACALGARARFVLGGRLPARPAEALTEALIRHGARIEGMGTPEVRVRGALSGGEYHLPGNISSQFVSALLFALPLLERGSTIYLSGGVESVAYIDMTLDALRAFGVRADIKSAAEGVRICVPGGQAFISPGYVKTEGDWSSAACLLCGAAASGSEARISGLNILSKQGDRAIMDILRRFGARAEFAGGEARVSPGTLVGCDIDVSGTPDLAPAIAILGAAAKGETVLSRAGRLRFKESDRVASIPGALAQLGAHAWADGDAIRILGAERLRGGDVDSAGDHRIVMMAACLAPVCLSPVRITRAEAVNKSYPGCFDALERMGLSIIREGGA